MSEQSPIAANTANAIAGLAPRQAALQILIQILDRRRPLDTALNQNPLWRELPTADRAMTRWLLAGTLRRLGQIDALWQHCLNTPLPDAAKKIPHILRLGVAQLVFLGTPAHAAIFLSVELCRESHLDKFKPLVNAVLRRLQNEAEAIVTAQDSFQYNVPSWLRDSWIQHYGEPTARAIAQIQESEPPLDITVKTDPELWAEKLGATILPNGSLRLKTGGTIEARDGFGTGSWWIQDMAASLPARVFGPIQNQTIIDLCAAPGGKTAQLCNAGARVIAVDTHPARLEKLAANLHRLNFTAEIIQADAGHWLPLVPADGVLLDAPCSATGTIRRHPDLPYLKTPADIARLADLQLSLLRQAVRMVKIGGYVVYAVCSLEYSEGPEMIEKFLSTAKNCRRAPITVTEFPELSGLLTAMGDIRTLPCDFSDLGGMDGFFVCRLQRLA